MNNKSSAHLRISEQVANSEKITSQSNQNEVSKPLATFPSRTLIQKNTSKGRFSHQYGDQNLASSFNN